jgi:hypothetical protein
MASSRFSWRHFLNSRTVMASYFSVFDSWPGGQSDAEIRAGETPSSRG